GPTVHSGGADHRRAAPAGTGVFPSDGAQPPNQRIWFLDRSAELLRSVIGGLFALDALVVAALSQDGCVTEVDDGRCLIMCFFHGFSFRGSGTTIEINRTILRRRFPLIHPRVLAEKRERINANKVNMTSAPVVESVCHPVMLSAARLSVSRACPWKRAPDEAMVKTCAYCSTSL